MKEFILKFFIGMLVKEITTEKIEEMIIKIDALMKMGMDKGLDALEDYIEKSETKLDDKLLPLFDKLREALNVPDNDPEE